jgi:hypothetical protein
MSFHVFSCIFMSFHVFVSFIAAAVLQGSWVDRYVSCLYVYFLCIYVYTLLYILYTHIHTYTHTHSHEYIAMIGTFLLGYVGIIFETAFEFNKAGIALLMCTGTFTVSAYMYCMLYAVCCMLCMYVGIIFETAFEFNKAGIALLMCTGMCVCMLVCVCVCVC